MPVLSLAVQSTLVLAGESLALLNPLHQRRGLTHYEASSTAAEKPTATTPSDTSNVLFHFKSFP